jgi:SAM-dependent methyltransferase
MTELMRAIATIPPGCALDLACGSGRHSIWLRERGWNVTGVDLLVPKIPGATMIQADLEAREYTIEPDTWNLIVCWLYWQADLLPEIARGVRVGGTVAMAGKTSGRFETSLARYRTAFPHWTELASGEDAAKAFFIAVKPA